MDEPACSKATQKKMLKKARMAMAAIPCQSRTKAADGRDLRAQRPCRGHLADAGQVAFLEEEVGDKARHHAHPSRAKAPMPAKTFALGQIAANDGPRGRSGVDPHVEDGEGRVAPPVARLIELAHHGRDVGLEEPRSQNDERQPQEKRGPTGHRQAKVARGDHDAADDDGAVGAEEPVSQIAAEKRSQVHQADVPAVEIGGLLLGPTEPARGAD